MAVIRHVQAANVTFNNYSTTASSTTVTAAATSFQTGSANVGVGLTVTGAGVGGSDYYSTIASITDATHAVMALAATGNTTTVAGSQGQGQGAGLTTASPGIIVPNAIGTGDLLVAGIHWDPADTTTVTIADTAGNTWVSAGATIANADYNLHVFYCLNAKPSAAGANTVSFTISSAPVNNGELSMFFSHFSGPGTWIFDGAATGNSTGTNCVTSTGLTTSRPNSVFWAMSGVNNHVTAVGSGFTDDITIQQGTFTDTPDKEPLGDISQYIINTTLQTNQTVAVTQGVSGIFLIAAMAFSLQPYGQTISVGAPRMRLTDPRGTTQVLGQGLLAPASTATPPSPIMATMAAIGGLIAAGTTVQSDAGRQDFFTLGVGYIQLDAPMGSFAVLGQGLLGAPGVVPGPMVDTMAGVGGLSAALTGSGAFSDTMAGVGALSATLTGSGALSGTMSAVGGLTASGVTVLADIGPANFFSLGRRLPQLDAPVSSLQTMGAGLLAPSTSTSLSKQFYLLNQQATNSTHGSLQDGGTPPSVATTATGWRPGTGASANTYSEMKYANDQGFATFGSTVLPSGAPGTADCWRTQNTLNGTFSAGIWTFAAAFIAQSSSVLVSGNLRVRMWHSSDPSGQTNISEMTVSTVSLTIVTNLTNSAQQNTTASIALPAATLAGEYLFLECAWLVDTVSGGATSGLWFRQDGSNSFVLSPPFTASSLSTALNGGQASFFSLGPSFTQLDSPFGSIGKLGQGLLAPSPPPSSLTWISNAVGGLSATLTGAGALSDTMAATGALSAALTGSGALADTMSAIGGMIAGGITTLADVGPAEFFGVSRRFPQFDSPIGSIQILGIGLLAAPPATALTWTSNAIGGLSGTLTGAGALADTMAATGTLSATLGGSGALTDTMAAVGALSAMGSTHTNDVGRVSFLLHPAILSPAPLTAPFALSQSLMASQLVSAPSVLPTWQANAVGGLSNLLVGQGALSDTMAGVGGLGATLSGAGVLSDVFAATGGLTVTLLGVGSLSDVMAGVGTLSPAIGLLATSTMAAVGGLGATVSGVGAIVAPLSAVGGFIGVSTASGSLTSPMAAITSLIARITQPTGIPGVYLPAVSPLVPVLVPLSTDLR